MALDFAGSHGASGSWLWLSASGPAMSLRDQQRRLKVALMSEAGVGPTAERNLGKLSLPNGASNGP